MLWITSIILGTLMILVAAILIRREFQRAIHLKKDSFAGMVSASTTSDERMDTALRHDLNELNRAFYDIAEDLEGKYAVHERQIADLEQLLVHFCQEPELKKTLQRIMRHSTAVEALSASEEESLSEEGGRLRDINARLNEGVPVAQVAKEFNMGVRELQLMLRTRK